MPKPWQTSILNSRGEIVQAPGVDVGLGEKVDFLRRPEVYSEGTRTVEALETHMSWVFLTDRHAYKLKKPVRYSFLDFSTIEARRFNCEAEVRLNSRLAPDVYLGTVALTFLPKTGLQLAEHGEGLIVDWLVKMRRLSPERALSQVIANGVVTEADVRRIAEYLAAFYRTADRIAIDARTYRRRLERDIQFCRDELVRPEFGLPSGIVTELTSSLLNFLATQDRLLDARVGRIVEGHGDLRPEHVYLGEPPAIIDCLEFNREFRTIDPVDELAYLAMECDRLGMLAIDAWLFAGYRDQCGDDPPRPLIEFYKCARACLRAKIAIWHLDEPGVRNNSAKWTRQSLQYLALAQSYAAHLDPA